MHKIIMLLSVLCALLSDGLAAWGKTTNAHRLRPQRLRRAITGFLVACWKIIRVWATLHVLTILALVRGVTSGGRRGVFSRELDKWQLALLKKLPARALSRIWGHITRIHLAPWARAPLLGLYCALFKVNMEEAEHKDFQGYSSLHEFFTRTLKEEARPICPEHCLVSPADGTVLHTGRVEGGVVKQVKGVNYKLTEFLGPHSAHDLNEDTVDSAVGSLRAERGALPHNDSAMNLLQNFPHLTPSKGNDLFHTVIYLSPADYHHFHSPASWNVQIRRHFVGELLSVAPWVVRQVPSLFALSERVLLAGYWEYGFFSLTAVGAYNVGSIEVDIDEELETNLSQHEDEEGHVQMGEFYDKQFGFEGIAVPKGEHMGLFHLGSTVVLVFEAPKSFEFALKAGDRVKFGQPMGRVLEEAHLEFGDE